MGNTGFLNIRKGEGDITCNGQTMAEQRSCAGGNVDDAVLTAIDPDRFLCAELAGM